MKYLSAFLFISLIVFSNCTNKSLDDLIEIVVDDLETSIDENPVQGQVIANLNASIQEGSLSYEIINQSPSGAVSIANNGDLEVETPTIFDFETNTQVSGEVRVSSGTAEKRVSFLININDLDEGILNASNFTASVLPKPDQGSVVGQLNIFGPNSFTIALVSESNPGAFVVNENTGQITVADPEEFARNTIVSGEISATDGVTTVSASITIDVINLWSGPNLTFQKAVGSDPGLEANQDRITDNVWITRSNNGGEIYNANTESGPTTNVSPAGTLWALGTSDQIPDLQFQEFRRAVRPNSVRNRNLILYLEEEQAYVTVVFSSWSAGGKTGSSGGFAYTRSTED